MAMNVAAATLMIEEKVRNARPEFDANKAVDCPRSRLDEHAIVRIRVRNAALAALASRVESWESREALWVAGNILLYCGHSQIPDIPQSVIEMFPYVRKARRTCLQVDAMLARVEIYNVSGYSAL